VIQRPVNREDAGMRTHHALPAALVAALAASALAVTIGVGSSHREAPQIMLDPSADNTDVYAFTAKDAPGSLTVVANWIPFEDPSGGPNFGKLDPKARYYVKIDNTGDGVEDVAYRWQLTSTFRNPGTFLAAIPPVRSIDDPNINFVQTYDLYRERYNRQGKVTSSRRIGNDLPVAPDNSGPKTFPDYDAVAAGAVRSLSGGGKTFVGPRDDPFFIDLAVIFDGLNIDQPGRPGIGTGNAGGGKDDVAGYNTHAFVLQVPESEVTRNGRSVSGPSASNAAIGVWSTTERKRLQVTDRLVPGGGDDDASAARSARRRARASSGEGSYVQVSRLGNPLVNEVVIPIGDKDKYNRTKPKDDAKNFGKYVLNPETARLMNALFDLGVKETDRTDIVTALLTGVPGLTQIGKNPVAADTLKLNLGVPPAATENRFGVLGGDNAGFPNGRRLADDILDIELRVIAGALVPADQGGKQIPLGDGVDQNDKAFLSSFPYVAPPLSGFDSQLKRDEPPHDAVPQPPN
jgi:Domain of unknown function (DUF4331)